MAYTPISNPLGLEIAQAMGLKDAISLDLHFGIDDIVVCSVDFYPDSEMCQKAESILKRYRLVEIEEGS